MTMPDRIQITHQPRTMATPTIRTALERLVELDKRIEDVIPGIEIDNWIDAMDAARAALTSDDIPPAPLSEDDLRRGWNQQADEYNQWESLDSAEQLAWAQALAIKADRHAAALKAKPEKQRPTDEDLYDLAAEFNGDPVSAIRHALELWGNPLQGAPAPEPQTPPTDDAWWPELVNEIARVQQVAAREGQGGRMDLAKAVELWCRPATPQAPEPGEVEELHPLWYLVEFLEGHSLSLRQKDPTDELAQVLSDSATLFKRLASPAYPIVDRLPEGCLDLLKSEPGRITACSAGVSIEPLRLEPVAEIDDRQREAVHQAVAEALGTAYDCQRVWEAWNVGTMGPDDFVLVAEDSNRVAEIADAAIDAIWAILAPAPVPVGECPNCGYEGEIAPAPQAGEVQP